MGFNIRSVAHDWTVFSLRSLLNLRLLIKMGSAPKPLLDAISESFGNKLGALLKIEHIPGLSDLLAGQTGDIKGNIAELLDTKMPQDTIATMVQSWVQALPRLQVKPIFMALQFTRTILDVMSFGITELLAIHVRR